MRFKIIKITGPYDDVARVTLNEVESLCYDSNAEYILQPNELLDEFEAS